MWIDCRLSSGREATPLPRRTSIESAWIIMAGVYCGKDECDRFGTRGPIPLATRRARTVAPGPDRDIRATAREAAASLGHEFEYAGLRKIHPYPGIRGSTATVGRFDSRRELL